MARNYREEITPPSLESERAIELLKRQIGQIDALLQLKHDDPEVAKWNSMTEQVIIKAFGKPHDNLSNYYSARHGGPMWVNMSDSEIQKNFVNGLQHGRKILEGFIEQLELFGGKPTTQNISQKGLNSSKDIFIVHGRNEALREAVARFIEKLELKPTILHEKPNAGRTVIEKLEGHSDVGFAVILLSADDVGALKEDKENLKSRARQNVILELGYFFGRVGRSKVCVLYEEGVEIPADIHGLLYILADEHGAWKLRLAQEIRQAGIGIDLNKAIE